MARMFCFVFRFWHDINNLEEFIQQKSIFLLYNIENLRIVNQSQNGMNRKLNKTYNNKLTTSKYKGVTWHKKTNKWQSQIVINGKVKHLGIFTNEIDAAKTYNKAAIELYGEYANLNEI